MLECGNCGCQLHDSEDDEFCDGDELVCADCGTRNSVGCDAENPPYICHWTCVHGNGADEVCEECEP